MRLCTNFGEFKRAFGDFSTDVGQSNLAHAVYGFFNNGGTRCYVVRMKATTETRSRPGGVRRHRRDRPGRRSWHDRH